MSKSKLRTYQCTACEHTQQNYTSDFSSGHAPLCNHCHGTLKRATGPSSRCTDEAPRGSTADSSGVVDCSDNPRHPNLARNGDRLPADARGSETCPF